MSTPHSVRVVKHRHTLDKRVLNTQHGGHQSGIKPTFEHAILVDACLVQALLVDELHPDDAFEQLR